MRAILFDLDGVIYQGDSAVAGAARTLDWVHEQEIPHLFLTNTTSRPRAAISEKLDGMGIRVAASEILTPLVAAMAWLQERGIGDLALFVPEATREELAGVSLLAEDRESGAGAGEALMIGDDIRGDVGWAQQAGIRALLVRTGKFQPADLSGDILPNGVPDSVADLPEWWRGRSAAG